MGRTLSKRLETIIGMVSCGNSVCDVGCDHGYVSIELVKRNISPFALAMDINEGPLERAKAHVREEELENKIKLVLSNGLDGYNKGDAKTLIIAGMGGHLMSDILERNIDKCDFEEMILSPQSEIMEFRLFLQSIGCKILDENMVFEDGKYYTIIKTGGCSKFNGVGGYSSIEAFTDNSMDSHMEAFLGPVLLKKKDPVFKSYVKYLVEKNEKILRNITKQTQTEDTMKRASELSKEVDMLKKVLENCN